MFTPSSDGTDGKIQLFLSGESEIFKAPIKSAKLLGGSDLEFTDNTIKNLTFAANQQLKINLELDFYDYCSMEVKMYATQK